VKAGDESLRRSRQYGFGVEVILAHQIDDGKKEITQFVRAGNSRGRSQILTQISFGPHLFGGHSTPANSFGNCFGSTG